MLELDTKALFNRLFIIMLPEKSGWKFDLRWDAATGSLFVFKGKVRATVDCRL